MNDPCETSQKEKMNYVNPCSNKNFRSKSSLQTNTEIIKFETKIIFHDLNVILRSKTYAGHSCVSLVWSVVSNLDSAEPQRSSDCLVGNLKITLGSAKSSF
jgi:hypothetical protein